MQTIKENRLSYAEENQRMAMDSVAIFRFWSALPCYHISLGHNVQGYGRGQHKYSPLHKHPAYSVDHKTPLESFCRDDKYTTQMDSVLTAVTCSVLCGNSLGCAVGKFRASHLGCIHGGCIRVIDT